MNRLDKPDEIDLYIQKIVDLYTPECFERSEYNFLVITDFVWLLV